MNLISQVSCGNCGKSHRIHRRLTQGIRYRFTCKRCGAVITFGTSCVRWAIKPEDLRSHVEGSFSGTATLTRGRDTIETSAPPAIPPPIPVDSPPLQRRARSPVNDTMADGTPPIHLSPLLQRGVEREQESSRVRWLRQRWKTAVTG